MYGNSCRSVNSQSPLLPTAKFRSRAEAKFAPPRRPWYRYRGTCASSAHHTNTLPGHRRSGTGATRPQKSNRNQIWAILIRPTFPFFSGPKFELLCESRLGLLSLLCGIILCEPHCQSRFWNPTPLPVRLKFSGFFSGCLCFPCCKATTTGEEGCCFFRGNRGSLAKIRGAGYKLNI